MAVCATATPALRGCMAEQSTGGTEPLRASAWLAVGIVVLVAVIATAGIVAWARLGSGPATRGPSVPEPVGEEVPVELAGGIELGEVPDPVAAAFDGPVVAARLLDEPPADLGCDFLMADLGDDAEVETVLATPDVVHVSVIGTAAGFGPPGADGGQLVRSSCTMHWAGGHWGGGGGGMSAVDQPVDGMTGSSCCDENGLGTAEAAVTAPEGAQWAVQARGGYHLAYPVSDSRVVPVSWPFRAQQGAFGAGDGMQVTASTVTFVDDDGEVIGEVTVRS